MDARVQVYSDKMQKAFEFLEADFAAIRAGRANPHVLDKLRVDYYGTPTPIQQVGNVTVPEARIIQIAPWEKSLIKEIEKAIMTSDIGINPSNDGSVIRLVFPELGMDRTSWIKSSCRSWCRRHVYVVFTRISFDVENGRTGTGSTMHWTRRQRRSP